MKITKEVIARLNPCSNRYENYLQHYGTTSLTKAQFMGRKNITQADKMWVAFRLMAKAAAVQAAADIAESVLHIYEDKYPGDLRPRKAIEAARSNTATPEIIHASYAAAVRAAASSSAFYAASAAYAPYNAAASAAYAPYNAAASAAYNAATAAAASANAAHKDRAAQEKLIRKIVLKHWKTYE